MVDDRNRALLELLFHVSREVATAIDLRTVLQRVVFLAIENVGAERGSVVVLDDNGKPLEATIIYGKTSHEHTTQQLRETVERGLAGWVVRNRKPALLPDTSQDERWLRRPDDSAEQTGAKSAICVPLLARERLVGVLTLVHSLPGAFGAEHLELVQAIADQAGVAVLNARLYTESQRQARVMTALAEGAVAMNVSLRLEEVLQRVLTQTMQALQVGTAALALADPGSGDLIFQAAAGHHAGNIIGRHIPAGQGILGQVAREGRGLVIPNASQDSRLGEGDRFSGIEARAIACAPIQAQGQVIGVLEAINPAADTFDPDALLVMTGIGSLAGSAIQNAQLFERLQAAHQRYREMFEDSIDPILITDWDGRILEANRKAVEISGYGGDRLRGMSAEDLHTIDRERTGAKFEQLADGQYGSYESELRRQDGSSLPIEVHVRRVEFEQTDSLQWILRDISERKGLDSLREDLTAMIYHDLRSPLANIVSSLDVLAGMLPTRGEQVDAILGIANHSTARVQRLISSLLDVSRLESGQKIAAQRPVDPGRLVREAAEDVRPAANSRRQTIEVELPAKLPAVWIDEDMIRRVLINLLENASKFTPADGKISVGALAEKAGWVRVWVQDNGPGIPPADKERIFDKYTRLKSGTQASGLGIGLAFCRLAVVGHGGRIWVESQPDRGARFLFTLPVAPKEPRAK